MGRCGNLFAIDHQGNNGVIPDILTMSKTLGNGLPLSAVVTSNKVARVIEERGFLFYTTHANDPLPCSVGLKFLEIVLRDNLTLVARQSGLKLPAGLYRLMSRYGCIGDIRERDLMPSVEIIADCKTKAAAIDIGLTLSARAYELGLSATISARTYFSGCLRIAPPIKHFSERA